MNIHDAIKQKQFNSIQEEALVNLIYTVNRINSKNAELLKPFNLSPQQYNLLRILKGVHPKAHTIQAIKQRMLDKTPNTTRLIDKLEQAGYVLRDRCTADRRVIYVSITSSGISLVNQLTNLIEKSAAYTAHLTHEEATQLSELMNKIRDYIDKPEHE